LIEAFSSPTTELGSRNYGVVECIPPPTLVLPLPLGGGGLRWEVPYFLLLTSYFSGERRKVEERGGGGRILEHYQSSWIVQLI